VFVYKIVNSINPRVYVGLTTFSLEKRWREHRCAANVGIDKPLYRAMRKHGIDNFKMELVYTATSIEDLRAAELRYIDELKAHVEAGGYNLTDHGFHYGTPNAEKGEHRYNAVVTEQIVAFIRDPIHWDTSNTQMLKTVGEMFGFSGARDTIRDARRGDAWKHLNEKYPPVKVGQGTRRSDTKYQRQAARETMAKHAAYIHKCKVEARAGKRAPNAKLSEQTVKDIFYSPLSLLKTAEQYGVSKKMVLLIKQRKAHVYLTKEL
jgi:group I intron endonuclease